MPFLLWGATLFQDGFTLPDYCVGGAESFMYRIIRQLYFAGN